MTESEGNAAPYREELRGGQAWSRVLRRGQLLRITDVEGGATVAALFYNADAPLERYNMPDTLKAQHVARLTRGYVLYSDMGRILCSIVEDTAGWHDTISGHGTQADGLRKYGPGSYQALRNDFHRNTRDNFLVELGKYGLGKRDLVPNVNFFAKIVGELDGKVTWAAAARPGAQVTLRTEMNTLVILSNTPHPMDPSPGYAPKPVHLEISRAAPPGPDDECRLKRPENGRGFQLTESYFT